jgi:ABC-type transport system involved in multi-copper enzyme maturation permease subunit
MTKTLALLLDSYRELNARRLFWIVLLFSGLVVGAFAMIGLKNDTITILWFETPLRGDLLTYLTPATLYKDLFDYFGVGFWLAWLGNILALVSTAGVFPDFLAAGSIDLYLCKPISRLRLFITKYVGGLLFVTLQVTVFSTCSFLLLGTRGHSWEPAIFLSIPLVVLVFSYLFSICVLLGVLTRSTIAALLLTLLAWFVIWGVQTAEFALLRQRIRTEVEISGLDQQISNTRAELAGLSAAKPSATTSATTRPNSNPFAIFTHNTNRSQLQDRLDQLTTERSQMGTGIYTAHKIAYAVLLPLPKTAGTTELLTRALTTSDDTRAAEAMEDQRASRPGRRLSYTDRRTIDDRLKASQDARSATWILGTSIAFELVVLGLAAWIFCRRDY